VSASVVVNPTNMLDNSRVTAKAPLPEAMTQDDDCIATRNTVFFSCERSSEVSATAEHREIVL
jgi:hypothetical protein